MQPRRRIFRVTEGELAPYRDGITEVPVRLEGPLAAAEVWALVPFPP